MADAVKLKIQTYLDKLDANVSSRHPADVAIPADVKYVNSVAITGVGTESNPWSPA